MGKDLVFILFVAMTLGGAAIVVFAKRIIYNAFALMMSLFGLAGLYVFLSADFIAAVQVVVYIGGIMVLLLFGVLLTTKLTDVKFTTLKNQRIWGALTLGFFLLVLGTVIQRAPWIVSHEELVHDPQSARIGELLMTKYLLPFEIASVLLLAALIGAMFIVRSEHK